MNRMKGLFLVTVSSMLLLAGCSSSSDKIKVGLNFELSGAVASYGQAEVQGIELAIEQINAAGGIDGKLIELIKRDNKSDAAETTSIATFLATQEKVSVILGAATSGLTKAQVPVANQYKVPLISPSATADDVTNDGVNVQPFVYRVSFIDSFQGITMANFASKNLSKLKAVILGDQSSDYAKGLAETFSAQFKSNGGTVVAQEAYVSGEQDFNGVLTRVAQMDFDVLFVPGYYQEVGLIIKQAREAGITTPILGGDGFDSPVLFELAGKDALYDVYFSQAYSSLDQDPMVTKFIADFKAKYGVEPNAFSALGYDTALLAVDAIRRAGSSDPEKINEALGSTVNFQGVTGSITVDKWHNAVKSAVVLEIQDGTVVGLQRVNP
ncbi:MAG TPA: ethanolamine utilization protein EutJ [Erysipelotrichaceae bacterium]|nr:ethanolamine utilization protein EutJ [Erysipelotrichaceae bacterium]